MKKSILLLFLLVIMCQCTKLQVHPEQENKQQLSNTEKLKNSWVINASDTAFDYPLDTLYMFVNGKQVGTQANIVNTGDTVAIYYNTGIDSTNTLKVSLSAGKLVLKQYWDTSATIVKFKLIIP